MSKEYSDREIVEYLDESVCWHEWKIIDDWAGLRKCESCGKKSLLGGNNLTPTLEWMLERLLGRDIEVSISPWVGSKNTMVILYNIQTKEKISNRDKTPTLALRGAVCKMIKEEDKGGI